MSLIKFIETTEESNLRAKVGLCIFILATIGCSLYNASVTYLLPGIIGYPLAVIVLMVIVTELWVEYQDSCVSGVDWGKLIYITLSIWLFPLTWYIANRSKVTKE